jgi:hypothetical protein
VPFNSWFRALGDLAPTTGRAGTQFGFASELRIPYSWQWNLTLEGSIAGGGVLSAGWVGSRSRNLLRREGYLPAISLLDRESPARIFTNEVAPALVLATSNGESSYHALQVHYRRNVALGLSGIVSYAWSHSIDIGSWDSGSYLVGTGISPQQDRGSSNFDVRHSVSAGFRYDLPTRKLPSYAQGWSLHGIVRARTGFPIDVLMGENSFGFGFDNAPRPDRVPAVPVWISDAGHQAAGV